MPDRQPPPTQQQVFELLEERRALFAAMHAAILDAEKWFFAYERNSPVLPDIRKGFPAGVDFDIPASGWQMVNRAKNSITSAEVPQALYELPDSYKDDHQQAADDEKAVQLADQAILHHVVTRSVVNPFDDALQNQLAVGLGVLYYPLDYDGLGEPPEHGRGTAEEQEAWEAYEWRRAEALPWAVSSLHPTWVFPDPDDDDGAQDGVLLIERPVSLAAMQRRYPDLQLGAGNSSTAGAGAGGAAGSGKTATWVEYISPAWYGCWVNGQAVTPGGNADGLAPNHRGFVWAQLAWSGFGKTDRDGAWERRGIGLLQLGANNFRREAFNSNWLQLIKRAYIPKLIAQGDTAADAAEETRDVDPSEPSMIALGRTVSLSWLETPDIPAALVADIRHNDQDRESLFGPGVLSGENRSEPASKFSARLEQARGPYRTPAANMEQAIANFLNHCHWDLKHEPDLHDGYRRTWRQGRGTEMRRYSVHLKPEQIHLGGKITIDLSPMTPQDKAFVAQEAIAKRDAGLISTDTAMKKGAEVDDTDEEWAQIIAEKVLQSDAVIGALGQKAVAVLGLLQPQPTPQQPPPPPGMPGMAAGPAGAPMPAEEPLPPGMPQTPPPPLGSGQEAMQQAQATYGSAFRPPARIAGGY